MLTIHSIFYRADICVQAFRILNIINHAILETTADDYMTTQLVRPSSVSSSYVRQSVDSGAVHRRAAATGSSNQDGRGTRVKLRSVELN